MDNYLVMIQDYVVSYGIKLVSAILILIIGLWIVKFLSRSFNKFLVKRNVEETVTKFLTTLVRISLIVFVIVTAINQVGIETTSFVAILGAAGLAIGLALQGSLSNFASGVMLILFKPFKVGDYIEGGGISGSVDEIGIFVTKLTSPDNKVIFVPNSKIASDSIVNYSMNDTRRVDLVFGIGYNDDIDKARNVISEILAKNEKILDDPSPKVKVHELADSSVNFIVRPWVKKEDYWPVYWELTEIVKKKFDEQNIEIPYPKTDINFIKS